MKKYKGKKLYSIFKSYDIAVKAFRSIPTMVKARKKGLISEQFQERLMLSVTAVNKCAMCSYAHTEMALKAGLSNEDIKDFLAGEFPNAPDDEVKALLFAEHYADSRTKPSKEAWQEIVNEYGIEKAKSILSIIRVISLGNCLGIVFGSFKNRFTKAPSDERSNIFYEISFILFLFIFTIPFGLLQALFMNLFRFPIIRFKKKNNK